MKVSLCITVLNEEGSIAKLLDSLLTQTKKAKEIVIVDGGSEDKTVQIIRYYQKKDKRIKLLIEKGSIAHGRNTAVELAKGPIIAFTDAGCVPYKDWLEKLTEPFKHKKVGMVAGFYSMPAKNPLQRCMNVFLGVPEEKFDSTSFLPSTRSVAFRKKVWEKIGGFSERLDRAGEDTLYFYDAVKTGVKIVRVEKAKVEWRELSDFDLRKFIKKVYYYARGDGQAGIWWHPSKQLSSHNIKIFSIYLRYLFALLLLILSYYSPSLLLLLLISILIYIFWSFRKVYLLTNDFKSGLWGVVIQVVSDFAVMTGFIKGFLQI